MFQKKGNDEDRAWSDFDPPWTGKDIVRIIPSDTDDSLVEAIAINMDSFALKRYISKNRITTESRVKFTKDKFFTSVYLHSLFLYGIFNKLSNANESENNWDIEDLIPSIFRSYTSFLLYLNTDEAILSSL